MRAFLARTGHYVCTASHADEAKALFDAEQFDVVLSDITMPGTNGHQLTGWIAAHYPATRILLMSGFDFDADKYPDSDRRQVLKKPFSQDEVLAAVDEALGKSSGS